MFCNIIQLCYGWIGFKVIFSHLIHALAFQLSLEDYVQYENMDFHGILKNLFCFHLQAGIALGDLQSIGEW